MKGIREAAMSPDDEPDVPKRSLFDSDSPSHGGGYGGGYGGWDGNGYSAHPADHERSRDLPTGGFNGRGYPKKDIPHPERFVVTFFFALDEIGRIADDTKVEYDWNKAQEKSQTMAYDRLEEILGKDFANKYSMSFDVTDSYDEYEVQVTLSPSK